MDSLTRSLAIGATLGLVLAAAPLAVTPERPLPTVAPALAKDNGGDHGGGGAHGGGHDAGDHGAAARGSPGTVEAKARATGADDGLTDPDAPPAADRLGRLNGFLHASEDGRLHAAPSSAVGMISHGYAEALADYVEARERIGIDPFAAAEAEAVLDRAAAILARAANKPLSPRIVGLINGEVATADFSDAELTEIANRANAE